MGEESRPLLTHKQTITVTCEPSEQHEETEKKKELAARDTAVLPKYRQYAMLAILLTVHFSVLCSDSSLYPFYGTTAKRKGLVDSQIGLVYAVYEIIRCLAAPFYGVLIATLKPKNMCVVGSLSSGLAVVFFGLAYYSEDKWFFALCLMIRILSGNGSVMFTVAMTSGLMKATSFKSTTIIAAMEASLAVGYTSGPLIGAGLYQIGGYVLCFVTMGAITSVLSLLMLPVMPKIEEDTAESRSGIREFVKMVSIPGVFLSGFLTVAMTKLGANIVFSFAGEWLIEEYDLSVPLAATFYMVASFTYTLSCYPFSYIISKGYVWSVMVVAMAIITFLMLVFSPKVLQLLFINIHYKWWYPVINYGTQTILYIPLFLAPYEASLHLASVHGYDTDSLLTHGLLAGINQSGLNFGAALAPMLSGAVVQNLGFEWNTIISASIFFTMVLLYGLYLSYMRYARRPLRPEPNTDNQL